MRLRSFVECLQAKRVHDAHHVAEHLQAFLYTYLSTQCTKLGAPGKDQALPRSSSLSRTSSIQRPPPSPSTPAAQLGTGPLAAAATRASGRSSGVGGCALDLVGIRWNWWAGVRLIRRECAGISGRVCV